MFGKKEKFFRYLLKARLSVKKFDKELKKAQSDFLVECGWHTENGVHWYKDNEDKSEFADKACNIAIAALLESKL